MYSTYKFMASLDDGSTQQMTPEAIVLQYQKTGEQKYLAAMYCRIFPLIKNISNRYFGLTSADRASYALEILDRCMKAFLPDRETDFSTMFYAYYSNELRTYTEMLSAKKRQGDLFLLSLEELLDAGQEEAARSDLYEFIVMDALNSCRLNDRERWYCQLILDNYGSNADIAKLMGVSATMLSKLRKSLRSKLVLVYELL